MKRRLGQSLSLGAVGALLWLLLDKAARAAEPLSAHLPGTFTMPLLLGLALLLLWPGRPRQLAASALGLAACGLVLLALLNEILLRAMPTLVPGGARAGAWNLATAALAWLGAAALYRWLHGPSAARLGLAALTLTPLLWVLQRLEGGAGRAVAHWDNALALTPWLLPLGWLLCRVLRVSPGADKRPNRHAGNDPQTRRG